MLRPYRNWDSVMSIDSVGATIHQYWELFFYKSMFKD
jgi:acyl-homoserine lactone acylase PvdQ